MASSATSSPRDQIHRLADGRHLSWRSFGKGDGPVLVYQHGFPGSRLEPLLLGEGLDDWAGTLIAVDRPGIGRSSYDPRSTPDSVARDQLALLAELGIDRFAVLGVSGGAPYALALAAAQPARVVAAGLVAGLAPPQAGNLFGGMSGIPRRALLALRRCPGLARLLAPLLGGALALMPGTWVKVVAGITPEPDRSLLREPQVRERVRLSFREHARGRGRGSRIDLCLYARGWDLQPLPATLPLLLWHGDRDGTVPPNAMTRIAAVTPHACHQFVPGEGHFSLPIRHWQAMVDAVLHARPGEPAPPL